MPLSCGIVGLPKVSENQIIDAFYVLKNNLNVDGCRLVERRIHSNNPVRTYK